MVTLQERSRVQSKHIYMEAIRIFACLLVIFNHTGDLGFSYFTTCVPGSKRFWIYMIPSIFCKAAVFLFFSISGALLLSKEETISVIWKKRIPKTFSALFLITLFRYCYSLVANDQPFHLSTFLTSLFSSGAGSSLWYLYAYIAFLVCLPLLSAFTKKLEEKHYIYMFVLCFVFNGVYPVVKYYTGFNIHGSFSLGWLFTDIVFYPCMGYYLHSYLTSEKRKKLLIPLWILNVVTLAVCCYSTYHYGVASGLPFSQQNSQAFHSTFVMINTVTLFISFQWLFEHFSVPTWMNRFISTVGGCTFGTYLIHEWLLYEFVPYRSFWWNLPWNLHIPIMVAAVINCILVLIIGTIITMILRHVPFLRKIL